MTVVLSSMTHLNKKRLQDVLKRGKIDIHSSTGLIVISIDFFLLSSPRCYLRFLILSFVFPGLFMAVVSVALDSHGNTRNYKRRKGEDSACRVYFHWFCTSVFPNSNLMSSQRPIFNWLRDQTINLLSI